MHVHISDDAEDKLKEDLVEVQDYSLVPEDGWRKFLEWYEMAPGSTPIARKVVEYVLHSNIKHSKVEVYLLEFKLPVYPTITNHPLSGANTVGECLVYDDCSMFITIIILL